MTGREFIESYFIEKQKHESDWEVLWAEKLKKFFGPYFLELRAEADRSWNKLPVVRSEVFEDDDTTSFITGGNDHHTKRYYVKQAGDQFTIERVMIRCEICEGTGTYDNEDCELCGGRGWDDWLD